MNPHRLNALAKIYLEIDPEVMGGEPVIRGTRMPVRGLARIIEAGGTTEQLVEDFPSVPVEAHEFAVAWAAANPRPPHVKTRDFEISPARLEKIMTARARRIAQRRRGRGQ